MKTYKANEIKNITFVSSVGFSETVLVETMMYEGRGILCRSNKRQISTTQRNKFK